MSDAKSGEGLRSLVLRNSVVEVLGYIGTQTIRLGGNLVTTRLLFPEAFGLMTIVNIVLMGLTVLSDVGILQAVVQNERGEDEEFLDTAWTLQIVRGGVLCLVAWALAYPISLLYEQPLLFPLLLVAGMQLLVAGFESSSLFTLRRRVQSAHLAAIEISVQAGSVIVSIVGAYLLQSVWALLIGAVAGGLVRLAWSHVIDLGYRNHLRWDPESRREIMHFGRWILGSSMATFVATQSDRLFIGRLLGMGTLGVYGIALFVSEAIGAAVNRAITGVLYPVFSQLHRDEPERLANEYYFHRLRIDAIAQPALGVLAMVGDFVIMLFWDDRYVEAGWMLRILCARVALTCLMLPCEVGLVATGHPRFGFFRSLATMTAIVIGVPLGYHYGGAVGIVCAVALSEVPAVAILWPAAARQGLFRARREFFAVGLFSAGLGLGYGVRAVLQMFF